LPPKAAPAEGPPLRPRRADASTREAHYTARPRTPPRGHTARTLGTHRRLSMKRPGDPPVTALIQLSSYEKHLVGMTLPPTASAATTLMGRTDQ